MGTGGDAKPLAFFFRGTFFSLRSFGDAQVFLLGGTNEEEVRFADDGGYVVFPTVLLSGPGGREKREERRNGEPRQDRMEGKENANSSL